MKLSNLLALVLATSVHVSNVNHVVVSVRRKNRDDVDIVTDLLMPTINLSALMHTASTLISPINDKNHNAHTK